MRMSCCKCSIAKWKCYIFYSFCISDNRKPSFIAKISFHLWYKHWIFDNLTIDDTQQKVYCLKSCYILRNFITWSDPTSSRAKHAVREPSGSQSMRQVSSEVCNLSARVASWQSGPASSFNSTACAAFLCHLPPTGWAAGGWRRPLALNCE